MNRLALIALTAACGIAACSSSKLPGGTGGTGGGGGPPGPSGLPIPPGPGDVPSTSCVHEKRGTRLHAPIAFGYSRRPAKR